MTQRAGRELTLYVLFIVKNLTNHLNICTTAFPTPITNKLFVNIAILRSFIFLNSHMTNKLLKLTCAHT